LTRPRLWVVSELYYPEETSTGYFLTRIAEGLADDFDVQVVCSRPTYSERHLEVAWHEERHGTIIHRMRSTRLDKDSFAGRVLNLVTFTLLAWLFCMLRVRRGDRILVVTNPPPLPPLLGLLTRLRGLRGILLVHDVYPEVLVATGHAKPGGPIVRLLGAVTRWTYRSYADVVVLGRDMEDVARPKIAGGRTRLHIIPNWGDVDEIVPIARDANPFRQAHQLDGRAVVQFSGNLGRTHDVETVLDAAAAVSDQRDVVFCFIGYGGKSALISQRQQASESQNLLFLPRQPREMLGAMLASADAAVIAFVDRMYGVSVPSRMYNIMAAGVPIIAMAHPSSELAQVVREEECGWVIGAADADGLAAVARSLATPEGLADAQRRGARGRDAVLRRFTLPVVVASFRELLRD
jgi:glycosyltransferase involved in cell wall biosynthesis